jgi:hypothetical protein
MDFDLMKGAIQRQDRVVSIHAADEADADEADADNLHPDDVWESIVANGEIIEDYPDARRGPCCLILWFCPQPPHPCCRRVSCKTKYRLHDYRLLPR